jgi:N-acetylmuramoyl-L-alanine amidase
MEDVPTMMTSGEANEPRGAARRTRRGRVLAAIAGAALAACSRNTGVNDPANELPFGALDLPTQGAQVAAESPVAGWALDDRGVRQIRVYVDGHLINTGVLSQDRPDVAKAFPQYARGSIKHGFTLLLGFDAPGPHTVIVQAVDTDGATRDFAVVNVIAVDK